MHATTARRILNTAEGAELHHLIRRVEQTARARSEAVCLNPVNYEASAEYLAARDAHNAADAELCDWISAHTDHLAPVPVGGAS